MITNENEFIWVEKYRPNKIEDCVLPKKIKSIALETVKKGNLQNLLFHSGAGMGKTTLAHALCYELDLDYILINGSKEGRLIDTVRTTVTHFANTVSINNSGDKPKVVIYDEVDNAGDVQMAIRGLIEDVSDNCRFIFTCNYLAKIIEPIHSRVGLIDFAVPKTEKKALMMDGYRRCCEILEIEDVSYDKKSLASFIQKVFPDFRKILNELQLYSATGKIDDGILDAVTTKLDVLLDHIVACDFVSCRKWVSENTFDGGIYGEISNRLAYKVKDGLKVASFIVLSADYQFKHVHAFDPEVNLTAFLVEIIQIL